jgi:hypothetical protein
MSIGGTGNNSVADSDFMEAKLQLDKYFRLKRISPNDDPFKWWEMNAKQFNYLVPLMKQYHSAPPGSVESERLFSTASFILNDLRTSLTPENLSKLLLLHHNIPLYQYNY